MPAHHGGLCWLPRHTTHAHHYQQQYSLAPAPWLIFSIILFASWYVLGRQTHTHIHTLSYLFTNSVFTNVPYSLIFIYNLKPNTCRVFRAIQGMCTAAKNLSPREHILVWGWTLCLLVSAIIAQTSVSTAVYLCHIFCIFCAFCWWFFCLKWPQVYCQSTV